MWRHIGSKTLMRSKEMIKPEFKVVLSFGVSGCEISEGHTEQRVPELPAVLLLSWKVGGWAFILIIIKLYIIYQLHSS